MKGGIFLICSEPEQGSRWSRWILEWIERSGSDLERAIYLCDSPELARESLAMPVSLGVPPGMVIVDREAAGGTPELAKMVSDCIPEAWVIEILSDSDTIDPNDGMVAIRRSACKEEWDSILHHCLHESPSPQWSRSAE
jgi:hypothetical protein